MARASTQLLRHWRANATFSAAAAGLISCGGGGGAFGGGGGDGLPTDPAFGDPCPGPRSIATPWEGPSPALGSVTFSPPGGTFVESQSVVLSAVGGGEIHYTLNGTVPTASSPVYSEPLTLSGSTRIRAAAFDPSGTVRAPAAASFVQLSANMADFSSNLPLVVIHTHDSGQLDPSSNENVPATLLSFRPGSGGRTSLLGTATVDSRVGINVRGNSSRTFEQKSYALEFWGPADNDGVDRVFVGLPAGEDFALVGPSEMDRSLIRNPLAYALSRRIGRYAPRTRQVEAFLVDSGGALSQSHYVGLYAAVELIRRGPSRVNVHKLEASDLNEPEISGGYIFRRDHGQEEFTADGEPFQWVYPNSSNMTGMARSPQREYLTDFVAHFLEAARSPDHLHPQTDAHYSTFIDVESFIDHNILTALTKNVDGLRLSAYMSKDRGGPIVAGPVWDFDRSMGTPYDDRATDPDNWSTGDGTRPLEWEYYGDLFRDADFSTSYQSRWTALRCANLTSQGLLALVDDLAAEVRPVAERHFAQYRELSPEGGSFENEISILKSWLDARLLWLDEEIPNELGE